MLGSHTQERSACCEGEAAEPLVLAQGWSPAKEGSEWITPCCTAGGCTSVPCILCRDGGIPSIKLKAPTGPCPALQKQQVQKPQEALLVLLWVPVL